MPHHEYFHAFQAYMADHGFDAKGLRAAKLRIHAVNHGFVLASPRGPNWIYRKYEQGYTYWSSTSGLHRRDLIFKHLEAYNCALAFVKQQEDASKTP